MGLTTITNDSLKLPVKNPVFETVQLYNGFGVEIAMFEGIVLAFNSSTGKYEATVSSIPAIANAKAICVENISLIGIGATLDLKVLRKGIVNQELLYFANGTDNVNTIPAGASDSFGNQLRDYGILLEPGIYIDEQDKNI